MAHQGNWELRRCVGDHLGLDGVSRALGQPEVSDDLFGATKY